MPVIFMSRLLLSVFMILGCKKNVDMDCPFFVSRHHCSQKNYCNGNVKICFDSNAGFMLSNGRLCIGRDPQLLDSFSASIFH